MRRIQIPALLATILAVSCTSAQSGLPDSHRDARYYAAVRDFVSSSIRSEGGPPDQFILEDSVTASDGFEFLAGCVADRATFTAEERQQIEAWAAHPPFRVWTNELVPGARIVKKDTIRIIFSGQHRDGWNYFYSHFGHSLNTLGCPLFLRNYSWCLFYSGNSCGWLCGGGQLALYKKEGDHWVFVKNWGSWVS